MENQAKEDAPDEMVVDKGSTEYRLLMAYCVKRRRQRSGLPTRVPVAEYQGLSRPKDVNIYHEGPGLSRPKAEGPGLSRPKGDGPGLSRPKAEGPGLSRPNYFEGLSRPFYLEGPGISKMYFQAQSNDPFDRNRETRGAGAAGRMVDRAMTSRKVFIHLPETTSGPVGEGSTLSGVADRLTQVADSVQITTDQIPNSSFETDGEEVEDVIQRLVELLKQSGDTLNEEIKKNKTLQEQLQVSFSYSLFEEVTSTLQKLVGVVPPSPGVVGVGGSEEQVHREQIALAFEVTSRLSAVDLHPMSRAMGYGVRYLQQHHSAWVQEHGDWENLFGSEDVD